MGGPGTALDAMFLHAHPRDDRHTMIVPRIRTALACALLVGACGDPSGPAGPSDVYAIVIDDTALPLVKQVTLVMREPGPARVT